MERRTSILSAPWSSLPPGRPGLKYPNNSYTRNAPQAARNRPPPEALGLTTPASLLPPVQLVCCGGLSPRFAHRVGAMRGASSVAIGGIADSALAAGAGGGGPARFRNISGRPKDPPNGPGKAEPGARP